MRANIGTSRVAWKTLEASIGRKAVLRWSTRHVTGETGLFRLRLPYATDGGAGAGVAAEGPYLLRSGGAEVPLGVTESSVREGRSLEAPPFDAPGAQR